MRRSKDLHNGIFYTGKMAFYIESTPGSFSVIRRMMGHHIDVCKVELLGSTLCLIFPWKYWGLLCIQTTHCCFIFLTFIVDGSDMYWLYDAPLLTWITLAPVRISNYINYYSMWNKLIYPFFKDVLLKFGKWIVHHITIVISSHTLLARKRIHAWTESNSH